MQPFSQHIRNKNFYDLPLNNKRGNSLKGKTQKRELSPLLLYSETKLKKDHENRKEPQ